MVIAELMCFDEIFHISSTPPITYHERNLTCLPISPHPHIKDHALKAGRSLKKGHCESAAWESCGGCTAGAGDWTGAACGEG
jgi:hypothetical protein